MYSMVFGPGIASNVLVCSIILNKRSEYFQENYNWQQGKPNTAEIKVNNEKIIVRVNDIFYSGIYAASVDSRVWWLARRTTATATVWQ